MKKLIVASSLAMITTFAVLLANASDDTTPSDHSDSAAYTESQKSGTTGSPETEEQKTAPGTVGTHADHWKTAKTCTDEAGIIHKRGQKGFNACVESMRKKEQTSTK